MCTGLRTLLEKYQDKGFSERPLILLALWSAVTAHTCLTQTFWPSPATSLGGRLQAAPRRSANTHTRRCGTQLFLVQATCCRCVRVRLTCALCAVRDRHFSHL